ncbi:phosphotransferase family protein [Frankia sp. Cr2]|uniref:phosphotransferase family protein n=1 Tax=Frankia sp. Cr2 TaxID=3073932 RepID=UPI002AD44798|nr:phosphotransferase [Frankia sp. Cr2]
MNVGTAVRPGWDQLPGSLRDALAARLGGPVTAAVVQTGGFTPGVAVRLTVGAPSGAPGPTRVFVKGLPVEHPLAGVYRAEAAACQALPPAAPAPALRWAADLAGWIILAFEDLPGGTVDLRPGSTDVTATVATLAALAPALTPCPIEDAPPAAHELGGLVHGWATVAADPPDDLNGWACRHLPALAAGESGWVAAAAGATLVHGDIRPDNLVRDATGAVRLVDWSYPCRGAAWLDVAALVPHLILAGHHPGTAEAAIRNVPAMAGLDPEVLTAFAMAVAGYWERSSRAPAPPGVPHLRTFQASAAAAGRVWIAHRTGWH